MIKISASIVIYNEKKDVLKATVESFLSIDLDKELIIVDNSKTNEFEYFCKSYNDVRYIKSNENIGFGAGHNLAYKSLAGQTNIYMILNPDIYFDSSDMKEFILWMSKQKDISLAVPKVCYPNGILQKTVRFVPTPLSMIKRRIGLTTDEIDISTLPIVSDIPFANGCFMVFRSDVFKSLCGFDERFFLYMEDVDIFLRAKRFGRTVLNQKYTIYHYHARGSAKKIYLLYIHIVSAIKFFLKQLSMRFKGLS